MEHRIQTQPRHALPRSCARTTLFLTAIVLLCGSARSSDTCTDAATCASACHAVPAYPAAQRPADKASAMQTVLITDGSNFDDLLTLLYVAKSPALEPVAVIVAGNAWAHAAPSRRVMRDVLHLFGRYAHVPIMLGAYHALDDVARAASDGHASSVVSRYRSPVPAGEPGRAACDDAFGAARLLPAAPPFTDVHAPTTDAASIAALAAVLEPLRNASVTVIVTGTLTPLALLFDYFATPLGLNSAHAGAASVILSRLAHVVVMGGAFRVPGNIFSLPQNQRGEFNIFNDPHGAQLGLSGLNASGVPVTMVPLDATRFAPLTGELLSALREEPETPEAQWAGFVLEGVKRVMDGIGRDVHTTVFLWDVVAVAVVAVPGTVQRHERLAMRVVTEQGVWGKEQGWTKVCDDNEVSEGMCTQVDVVLEVNGSVVSNSVLEVLQSKNNSAERALTC